MYKKLLHWKKKKKDKPQGGKIYRNIVYRQRKKREINIKTLNLTDNQGNPNCKRERSLFYTSNM